MGLCLFPVNLDGHLASLSLDFFMEKNADNSWFNFSRVTGKWTFLMRIFESHYANIKYYIFVNFLVQWAMFYICLHFLRRCNNSDWFGRCIESINSHQGSSWVTCTWGWSCAKRRLDLYIARRQSEGCRYRVSQETNLKRCSSCNSCLRTDSKT